MATFPIARLYYSLPSYSLDTQQHKTRDGAQMFFQRLYVDNWHLISCQPCVRKVGVLCDLHTLNI